MTASDQISRLTVTLLEVKPTVRRFIEVPLDMTLDTLHQILLYAMPWNGSHLHVFEAKKSFEPRISWSNPAFQIEDTLSSLTTTIADVMPYLNGKKSFRYLYDLGDSWDHNIRVGVLRRRKQGVSYPRLVRAEGRCPPDDVGGPDGYEDFLNILSDPTHPEHKEMTSWNGGPFDPQEIDFDALARSVERIAQSSHAPARRVWQQVI